ncbi:Poly(U)-specific endoribonuclease like protein, partial [Eufriesea mexicana]
QQNKDINTHFLNGEGGGAMRPRVVTESKQTSPYHPSAPQDDMIKSNTGSHLGNIRPTAPAQPHSSWSNPYLGSNKPLVSNSQPTVSSHSPPPIGFKDHVYPQTYPTSTSTQFRPVTNGHPPYPIHPMPSSNSWSHPISRGYDQITSTPLGNPYSMHTPGGAYSAPGQPSYYPQQTHFLAQPAVQPFVPGQTVVIAPGQQDSGRGFGQMVKEALVYSTINAGVNRILNPHTHHHYVESKPDPTSTSTTHITYNNQYFNTPPGVNNNMNSTSTPQAIGPTTNNFPTEVFNVVENGIRTPTASHIHEKQITPSTGSSASNDQKNPFNNPANINSMLSYRVSDDELFRISEELFRKRSHDISKYIKLNLQNRVTSPNVTDEAKEPLFTVDADLLEYPSIYVTRSLYDSYAYDSQQKLNRTLETRKKENLLIDTFLNTNEMAITMQWLADHGFIDPDDFERKDVIRRIWFTIFSGSSCGFERVFASENYGSAIIGIQDWIYFENQESLGRINYMGYVDKLDFGNTASLLKLNFQMDGIVKPNATIFVGTLPELEMSLYTICFYARPNNVCPVSLGGTKFNIYTHSFTYFGNEIIDLGLPIF